MTTNQEPQPNGNRAQTSGQFHDMMRTISDDGTIPPTAEREAITTPESTGKSLPVAPGALDSPATPFIYTAHAGDRAAEPNPNVVDLPTGSDGGDAVSNGVDETPAYSELAHRTPPEQPGQDTANPLPQALDPDPLQNHGTPA